jgi:IclR helix-turn-helix domain
MTHPPDRILQGLELAGQGLSATEIARRTGAPRATVRDWLSGRVPRVATRAGGSCSQCGGPTHPFARLPGHYVYLLGLYLGDGCLSRHPRGVFKLRVTLDHSYPGIIECCAQAMRSVLPPGQATGVATKKGCVDVYAYWKGWPCLIPQHGPGRKHDRPIALAAWQVALVDRHPEQLLRGLIHSDGCRFINTGTNWRNPRYSFSNRSADIRGIFCDACARLGVRWTTCPYTVYVSRKDDVARLDEFIGPKA